ncbi:hypothetical protein PG997_010032 [Apiospora hydei]|uniref:Lytic polysaccharide monooxygenase n=1 Tax=Apiospora hydei TaxID=1337664 RepID=A0ABR1VVU3_9PEZI
MYTATSKTLVAAALALLGTPHATLAHMIMKNPPPFGGAGLDNSPLTTKDYPCKVKGDPATFFKREKVTTVAVGEKQELSFTGNAVHGGGSCQLAVTKDLVPTASSHWQVILSIEGGCPSKDGVDASTYEWSIPDAVAPGDYVFQWSWISKLAGQPEFYMNCAALTVTGGKKKRDDDGGYEHERHNNETLAGTELFARAGDLPDLFVANLEGINKCVTKLNSDPKFPDPGPNVIRPGTKTDYAQVSGDCSPGGSGSGSGGSASAPASSAAAASSQAPPAGVTPSGFMTSIASAASSSAPPAAETPSPAATGSSGGSGSSSSPPPSGGETGACTEEGIFNCIGGSAYQRCASGKWTALEQMPGGTKCAEGKSANLWARGEAMMMRRLRR